MPDQPNLPEGAAEALWRRLPADAAITLDEVEAALQDAAPAIEAAAVERERERLLSDEAIERGRRVLDDDRDESDYAFVKRTIRAALDSDSEGESDA